MRVAAAAKASQGLNSNAIAVLMAVGANPGSSLYELQQLTGIPRATISRIVLDLSGHARGRAEACSYIVSGYSPGDLRRKEYHLSAEGRNIILDILAPLYPEQK